MPKISTGTKPRPELLKRYETVDHPFDRDRVEYEVLQCRNLQTCTCEHDRCCHGDYLGTGDERVLILDCPSAGACAVKGCKCQGFVFSKKSSKEGHEKRKREMILSKIFPPEEK